MDLKRTIPRSPEHIAFVKCFGCCVCHRRCDPHHEFGSRGTGIKPSDFGTVPLCRVHHTELHSRGMQWFENEYGICLMEVGMNVLHYRITGQPVTMHLVILEPIDDYVLGVAA